MYPSRSGPDHHPARLAVHRHVEQDLLVDAVIVPEVVRAGLVEPAGLARVRVAGEDAGGPEIVAGPDLGVPGPRIAGAVEDQVLVGVVGDPAPHRAAADPPLLRRPGPHTAVLALVLRVERLEVGPDQDVAVGAGVVGPPRDLAALRVDGGDPAAHAELAAGVPDQHLPLGDQGRHGDGLALVDVAELGVPELAAGGGVERDRAVVERVEEEPAVVEHAAAVDHVAAGDTLRGGGRLRLVHPLQRRAGLGEVERVDVVRVGRDDVHRLTVDDRGRLVAAVDAGREGEGDLEVLRVAGVDLVELGVAGGGVVLRRHQPAAVIGRRCRRGRHGLLSRPGLLGLRHPGPDDDERHGCAQPKRHAHVALSPALPVSAQGTSPT